MNFEEHIRKGHQVVSFSYVENYYFGRYNGIKVILKIRMLLSHH